MNCVGIFKRHLGPTIFPLNRNVYKIQKAAQEAHEAIRPTSAQRDPESLRAFLEPDMYKLYKLIWNRFVASQMTQGQDLVTQVDVQAKAYTFRASGTVEKFDGYRRVYREEIEQPAEAMALETDPATDTNLTLPNLTVGESLSLVDSSEAGLTPKQHFTQPPPRYNEALLIREMEEKGIGRPSTYATIISTIQDRHYVEKEEARLRPTELGRLVNDRLVNHFPNVFDVEFTAKMENELDGIEEGQKDWVTAVKDFYQPFMKDLESAEVEYGGSQGKRRTDRGALRKMWQAHDYQMGSPWTFPRVPWLSLNVKVPKNLRKMRTETSRSFNHKWKLRVRSARNVAAPWCSNEVDLVIFWLARNTQIAKPRNLLN